MRRAAGLGWGMYAAVKRCRLCGWTDGDRATDCPHIMTVRLEHRTANNRLAGWWLMLRMSWDGFVRR